MGTGVQARLQMQAAHLVRPFRRLLGWGRDPGKAAACARDLGASLGVAVEVMTDIGDLMAESQLVVTTTPARRPLIRAEWLHDGLHITAMGSDQPGKGEVEPAALVAADGYFCDRIAQAEVAGELEAALAAGIWSGRAVELGAVVAGAPGRTSGRDITICDLTGTGAQDTAIASHVMTQLGGAGTVIRA